MSNPSSYSIDLSNGSAAVLRHLLNQPGWTKTISEFVTAAQLLATVVPEPAEPSERPHPVTTPNYREALQQWKFADAVWSAGSVPEFTVNEKQRDIIKTCLKVSVEKQNTVPSKPAFDLFTAFGLTE